MLKGTAVPWESWRSCELTGRPGPWVPRHCGPPSPERAVQRGSQRARLCPWDRQASRSEGPAHDSFSPRALAQGWLGEWARGAYARLTKSQNPRDSKERWRDRVRGSLALNSWCPNSRRSQKSGKVTQSWGQSVCYSIAGDGCSHLQTPTKTFIILMPSI